MQPPTDFPPLVSAAAAHHWLAAHAGQRALARPLVALVADAGRAGRVREADVAAQGRRVFGNWRRLARVATDDAARPMGMLLEALLGGLPGGDARDGDAYDLVAFDDAATRVRALAADLPLLGLGHHVLLVNPRRAGRAARAAKGPSRGAAHAGLDRWLAIDRREGPPSPRLFPSRPGRPATLPAAFGRDAPRPPRVRTICSVRPASADAARVLVVTRWRDEPCDAPPSSAAGRARWRRQHTAIALATVFQQLAEVEAGSPAEIRA